MGYLLVRSNITVINDSLLITRSRRQVMTSNGFAACIIGRPVGVRMSWQQMQWSHCRLKSNMKSTGRWSEVESSCHLTGWSKPPPLWEHSWHLSALWGFSFPIIGAQNSSMSPNYKYHLLVTAQWNWLGDKPDRSSMSLDDTAGKTLGNSKILHTIYIDHRMESAIKHIFQAQPRCLSKCGCTEDVKEWEGGFMQVIWMGVHTPSVIIHTQTILPTVDRKRVRESSIGLHAKHC